MVEVADHQPNLDRLWRRRSSLLEEKIMKKAIGLLAVLALVAAPAFAGLESPSRGVPSLERNPGQHTVGVPSLTPGGTYVTFVDIDYTAAPSDLVSMTFAFHWPYVTPVYIVQVWSDLTYDSSEVEIVGIQSAGMFAGGTFLYTNDANHTPDSAGRLPVTPGLFPNPSSGTVTFPPNWPTDVLFQNPAVTTFQRIVSGSFVYPIFSVTVHIKDGVNSGDSLVDIKLSNFTMLFVFSSASPSLYWLGGDFGATSSYGVNFHPEPGSLALLGVGLATMAGGVWRRRRR
jgi:hypothetical protein